MLDARKEASILLKAVEAVLRADMLYFNIIFITSALRQICRIKLSFQRVVQECFHLSDLHLFLLAFSSQLLVIALDLSSTLGFLTHTFLEELELIVKTYELFLVSH